MPTTHTKDTAYVLKFAHDLNVKFIRLWFTDILGLLKSVAITIEELEEALEEGVGFDGSAIEGFTRIDESDMVARPDPNTFAVLPWGPEEDAAAQMICELPLRGGDPGDGADGDRRRVQPSRGGPLPARDGLPPHRCADDGQRRDDLPAGGQGDRPQAGGLCHLHAEANGRGQRVGDAREHVALPGGAHAFFDPKDTLHL